ncbi:proton-conducting transporter membrane subunit [Desulfonispora thiosulfatigenes]|nr:proton-conducting transporter membrane subunit [Desulfonispora thiosulfatigenes]
MSIIFIIMIVGTVLFTELKWMSLINILGSIAISIITLQVTEYIYHHQSLTLFNDFIYIDSLSVIQLLIVSFVALISLIYSYKYLKNEIKEDTINLANAKLFYFMLVVFYLSMVLTSITNNIVAMWISIEATTISTAFLIGFNRSKLSLEAAWKYIIICSIGISLGFVGIVIFIYSANTLDPNQAVHWDYLMKNYEFLDKNVVLVAFTFIFVGIGTKAGLAPMHTWSPQTHSEAPAPINALLAGVLHNLALYVIIRFYAIVNNIESLINLKYLFIVFGAISLIVSAFSLLRQTNYLRLLAFSSVENIGIMSLGIGIGGFLGTFGALLHSLIHAFTKTLLFLTLGNIFGLYKTRRINNIHTLIKTMPKNAVFLILGVLAITGVPPFASFYSEFFILIAGIESGHYITIFIYVLCLLLVFSGFINAFTKMIFSSSEQESTKSYKDNENIFPLCLTLILMIFISIPYKEPILTIINRAALIIGG